MPRQSSEATAAGTTRQRLIDAALELLVEYGYLGATSRKIAQAAGVNEITLYRHFASKDDLFAAALAKRPEVSHFDPPTSTGRLDEDLLRLADEITRWIVNEKAFFIRLIPELPRLPTVHQAIVKESANTMFMAMESIFRHYQQTGLLDQEAGDLIVIYFIGPIILYYLLSDLYNPAGAFDNKRYVKQFLAGYQTHSC